MSTTKRKATPAQLKALAKGRKIRTANLKVLPLIFFFVQLIFTEFSTEKERR